MGWHLPAIRDERDWRYGARLYCSRCCGLAIRWSLLAQAVAAADKREQRRAFAGVLEAGCPSNRGAWWCMECSGCGLTDAPALIGGSRDG